MWRITMTAPLLNAARNVIFLVCGSDKAPVLRDVLFGDHDSERKPAQLIRPAQKSYMADRFRCSCPVAARQLPRSPVAHLTWSSWSWASPVPVKPPSANCSHPNSAGVSSTLTLIILIALTDEDRAPWIAALHSAIEKWLGAGQSVVLAVSALKKSYRDALVLGDDVKLVYLRGTPIIRARLLKRLNYYMNPDLLGSQFRDLEEPEGAVVQNVKRTPKEIVSEIRAKLFISIKGRARRSVPH